MSPSVKYDKYLQVGKHFSNLLNTIKSYESYVWISGVAKIDYD
jgi:hypothetical protein